MDRWTPGTTTTHDGWTFRRASGPYIEITPPGCTNAVEVINVWNYATDEPTIPNTIEAQAETARRWLETTDLDTQITYVLEAREADRADELANRLQASATDLEQMLSDILADSLDRIDTLTDDQLRALPVIETATEALHAIAEAQTAQIDHHYNQPDEDTNY
jgi:hypothetical protein